MWMGVAAGVIPFHSFLWPLKINKTQTWVPVQCNVMYSLTANHLTWEACEGALY